VARRYNEQTFIARWARARSQQTSGASNALVYHVNVCGRAAKPLFAWWRQRGSKTRMAGASGRQLAYCLAGKELFYAHMRKQSKRRLTCDCGDGERSKGSKQVPAVGQNGRTRGDGAKFGSSASAMTLLTRLRRRVSASSIASTHLRAVGLSQAAIARSIAQHRSKRAAAVLFPYDSIRQASHHSIQQQNSEQT